MTTLEDEFVAALDALVLPAADVAETVMVELRRRSTRSMIPDGVRERRPHRPLGSRTLAVAVAAIIIVAGVVLVVAPARHAVARWLGIGATEIVFVPGEDVSIDDSVGSTPVDASEVRRSSISRDDLETTTLDPIATLGPPLGMLDAGVARGRSFFWLPTAGYPEIGETGFAVIVTARLVDGDFALKQLGGEVGVEVAQIAGNDGAIPALWIGGTHEFVSDPSSAPVLAERVLVWEIDGVQLRMESSLDRDQALILAAQLKEGTELLRPM